MRLVKGLAAFALAGGAAIAAPPPPPAYPQDLPQQAGGYDLPPIYQIYHFWVGRGREAALRKAMPHETRWQGKRHWGSVIFSQIDHYDYGMIRLDSLDRYCAGNWLEQEPPGDCDYRYRYAFVPGSLYSDERQVKLIRDSFRPEELTALLAREGWRSGDPNSLWSDQRLRQIFERHTDLEALYLPLVERHDVKASDCPGLKQALGKLDAITLSIDPARPGELDDAPAPHGQQTRIHLTAITSKGERVAIEGSRPLYALLEPVWAAVEVCSPPSYAKGSAPKSNAPR